MKDEPIYFEGDSVTTYLSILDTIGQQTESEDVEILKDILLEDPQGLFSREHIKHHPEANFGEILLRWLDKQPWEDMSVEWGIGVPHILHQEKLMELKYSVQSYKYWFNVKSEH